MTDDEIFYGKSGATYHGLNGSVTIPEAMTDNTAIGELIEMLEAAESEEGCLVFDHTPEEFGLHIMENHGDILATLKQTAWHSIEDAPPHACHVLAAYFDDMAGEWICEFVASPPAAPWTHWMLAGTPSQEITQ